MMIGQHDAARRLDAFDRAWQAGIPRLADFLPPVGDPGRRTRTRSPRSMRRPRCAAR